MVPSWADQLLPQLLMEQFDTLPIQYRHIEHMHEGVWLEKKYFFIKWHLWKLRLFFGYKLWYIELSGVNNFGLYSSFSLTLTVRGVSNKHCLFWPWPFGQGHSHTKCCPLYLLQHVTYAPAKFEVVTSDSLGGGAFTRKQHYLTFGSRSHIMWPMHLQSLNLPCQWLSSPCEIGTVKNFLRIFDV